MKDSDSSWVGTRPWWNSSPSFYFRIQIHVETKLIYSFGLGGSPKGSRGFVFGFSSALAPGQSQCGVSHNHQRIPNKVCLYYRINSRVNLALSQAGNDKHRSAEALPSLAPTCEMSQSEISPKQPLERTCWAGWRDLEWSGDDISRKKEILSSQKWR